MITANAIYNEIVSDVMSDFSFPAFMEKTSTKNTSASSINSGTSGTIINATSNVFDDENLTTQESFDDILTTFMESNVSDDELSTSITNAIHDASEKYDIDPNLIKAVIRQESNFDVYAVSSAGAQGLMQLMPMTAQSLGVTDSFDIEQNIDGGSKYLDGLLEQYDGDEELALAAYNAGPGNVAKYNGIPPFEETEKYVENVITYKQKYVLEQYESNK